MRHNIIYTLFALLLVAFVGCNQQDINTPEEPSNRTLTVSLSTDAETRAIIKDLNSKRIFMKWENGRFDLKILLKQGAVEKFFPAVEVKDASGAVCSFQVTVPEEIDITKPFDLYGIVAQDVVRKGGKTLIGVGGRVMDALTEMSNNRDGLVPVYFVNKGVEMYGAPVKAKFEHLGSLAVVTVLNKTDAPLSTAGFAVRPADGATEFYHKAALPFTGDEQLPYLDLMDLDAAPVMLMTRVTYPSVVIPANDVASVGFWFRSNTTTTPETKLAMYDAASRTEKLSSNSKPASNKVRQKGQAYHLYAEWDGTNLTLIDKEPYKPLPEEQPVMKFSTALAEGDTIWMNIGATSTEASRDVWIDLNNNGEREAGEFITEFFDETLTKNLRPFIAQGPDFAIYGEVNLLVLEKSKPTKIDVTKNPHLEQFMAFNGVVKTIDLSQNHLLRRVALEGLDAEQITLSPEAVRLSEIYFGWNKLKRVNLTMASNALYIGLAHNELSFVSLPRFKNLWKLEINNNQLSDKMLNATFLYLNKADGPKYYDWQYNLDLWDNPGTDSANYTLMEGKGWTVNKVDPEAQANQAAGNEPAPKVARQYAPLR